MTMERTKNTLSFQNYSQHSFALKLVKFPNTRLNLKMIILLLLFAKLNCEVKGKPRIAKPNCIIANKLDFHPELMWKHSGVLYLEVYYSLGSCNFSTLNPNQPVSNPSCKDEDEDIKCNMNHNKLLKVEFVNISSWNSNSHLKANTSEFQFNIQKALLRIPDEIEGHITCKLEFTSSNKNIEVTKIERIQKNSPTSFITVVYEPALYSESNCSTQILKEASHNLTNMLQTKDSRLIIEPMLNEFIVGGQRVTFRAREVGARATGTGAAAEERLVARLRAAAAADAGRLRVEAVRGGHFCTGVPTPAPAVCPTDIPVARRCVARGPRGARWELVDSEPGTQCSETNPHSTLLQKLADKIIRNGTQAGSFELHEIEAILTNITNEGLSKTDIWNIAQVLESIDEPNTLNDSSVAAVNNVVNMLIELDDREQGNNLQAMQQHTGTSNMILKSLDSILWKAPLQSTKELVVKDRITTFLLNTGEDNPHTITQGIGVRNQKEEKFEMQNIVEIPYNASLEWVLAQNFSVAVILPTNLIKTLSKNSHRVALSLFWNSKLFGGTTLPRISGHVLGVSIDGQHIELHEPITLLFKKQHDATNPNKNYTEKNICKFWNFEANNGNGKWSSAGCILAEYPNNTTDICVCTHLTHFGKLLYNAGNSKYSFSQESFVLDIVTIVGCSLSLLGLTGVFLSAILFPGDGTGRWLQLQLCAAQAVLMVAILWDTVAAPRFESELFCLMRGLLLHWSVLALGIWTLAAALYQHRRLTQPLHALQEQPWFLPTATVLSWGCPAVVCVIVVGLDAHAYEPHSCYPYGITLLLSVVVPLGSIVVANSIIFLLIIWSICQCSPQAVTMRDSQDNKTRVIRRVVASSYLFCLLGLCWLFGFLRLQYLFCISASLQGFSHFIFCVILDRNTRQSWHLYKKRKQMRFSYVKSWTRTSFLPNPKSKLSYTTEPENIKI